MMKDRTSNCMRRFGAVVGHTERPTVSNLGSDPALCLLLRKVCLRSPWAGYGCRTSGSGDRYRLWGLLAQKAPPSIGLSVLQRRAIRRTDLRVIVRAPCSLVRLRFTGDGVRYAVLIKGLFGQGSDRSAGMARRHRRPHGGIDSHIRPYPLLGVDDRASFTMENRRTLLQRELQTALLARRILVFYQPVVEFARDRVIRFEALPRWNSDRLDGSSWTS